MFVLFAHLLSSCTIFAVLIVRKSLLCCLPTAFWIECNIVCAVVFRWCIVLSLVCVSFVQCERNAKSMFLDFNIHVFRVWQCCVCTVKKASLENKWGLSASQTSLVWVVMEFSSVENAVQIVWNNNSRCQRILLHRDYICLTCRALRSVPRRVFRILCLCVSSWRRARCLCLRAEWRCLSPRYTWGPWAVWGPSLLCSRVLRWSLRGFGNWKDTASSPFAPPLSLWETAPGQSLLSPAVARLGRVR